MIGWEYPPHNSGGLGVACEGITQALSADGSQINFTLPHRFDHKVDHMKILECSDPSWANPGKAGVNPPFFAYSTEVPVPHVSRKLPFDRHESRTLPQSEIEIKVNQYADKVFQAADLHNDFDVIHAHDWMSFPAAMKVSQESGKPMVAHIHSTEYDRVPHGYGSQFISQTEYQGLNSAHSIVAVSYYTKKLLVDHYQIDPKKIHVVYNGISQLTESNLKNTTSFAPERPVIAFMGRLTMQKGADYFLALAKKVLEKLPNALFVVAGHGDMYHELLFKNAYQRLSASVLFSGFVRDKQKDMLLDRANVFVMPSVSEPFGLVALEAAQRQTPVIVSKNSGVSEVLGGSIVTDFWDIEKMTDEIVRLVSKPEYSQQVVNSQNDDMTQVSWKNAASKIREIYMNAIKGVRA